MNTQNEQVLVALRRVIRAMDLHSKYLAKTTGLTTPQLLLLQSIHSRGAVSIGELALDISLSQATVTSILDRLQSRGLVIRKRSTQDRRKVHAYLTKSANKLLQKAPVPLQKDFTERFGRLEAWEQSMILAALQRLAQLMDADALDAAPLLHNAAVGPEATALP